MKKDCQSRVEEAARQDWKGIYKRLVAFGMSGQENMLQDEYPDALVDDALREAGVDPDALGVEGEAFVAKLVAKNRAR